MIVIFTFKEYSKTGKIILSPSFELYNKMNHYLINFDFGILGTAIRCYFGYENDT